MWAPSPSRLYAGRVWSLYRPDPIFPANAEHKQLLILSCPRLCVPPYFSRSFLVKTFLKPPKLIRSGKPAKKRHSLCKPRQKYLFVAKITLLLPTVLYTIANTSNHLALISRATCRRRKKEESSMFYQTTEALKPLRAKIREFARQRSSPSPFY